MEIYTTDILGADVFIRVDSHLLRSMVVQAAATVIAEIHKYPVGLDYIVTEISIPGAGQIIDKALSANAAVNALQSGVQLLHETARQITEGKLQSMLFFDGHKIIPLIGQALQTYQDFKEKMLAHQREINGEHWGTATGFSKARWDEYNEKLYTMLHTG